MCVISISIFTNNSLSSVLLMQFTYLIIYFPRCAVSNSSQVYMIWWEYFCSNRISNVKWSNVKIYKTNQVKTNILLDICRTKILPKRYKKIEVSMINFYTVKRKYFFIYFHISLTIYENKKKTWNNQMHRLFFCL